MSYYLVAPLPGNAPNGRDLFWEWDRKSSITMGYFSREYAEANARDMSQLNPGVEYGVFQVSAVFETRKPAVPPARRKKVTETGEILPEAE